MRGEWLYEDGIAEERAILVDGGTILAARIDWGEGLAPGLVADARLVAKRAGAKRGTARFGDGAEALVDALPPSANEGDRLRLRVTRSAIGERGRLKLAQARPAPGESPRPAPTLLEGLQAGGRPVHRVSPFGDDFARHGWDDLIEEALSGTAVFPGGSLTIVATPAMTLIDVDGEQGPRALALAAVPAIVASLGRLDLAGSIGIDFPSLADKRDRQAVDVALGQALAGWRGERTAMNGFGFVQLVSRLERPSLLARLSRPAEAGARMLLRRAERVSAPGAIELVAHPAVRRAVRDEWSAELARRTGRALAWREDPGLALSAGSAQAVAR